MAGASAQRVQAGVSGRPLRALGRRAASGPRHSEKREIPAAGTPGESARGHNPRCLPVHGCMLLAQNPQACAMIGPVTAPDFPAGARPICNAPAGAFSRGAPATLGPSNPGARSGAPLNQRPHMENEG
ncbi:MAG: hypothetical protein HYV27_22115 [Candidatus Hydrogenedentes bacterium]|nr:hypothetical protein [Candidatus Hydrogenedentota bacterium]